MKVRVAAGSLFLALTAIVAEVPAAAVEEKFTYADLVQRLLDLEHLSVLPSPDEHCAQWSSYDRASKYDAKAGKYVRWDANGDGNGTIRKEGDGWVLAEMEGPGCIWRTWSARATQGHVKIFLDGQSQPAVDLPFEAYFDGKHAPFHYPMLSYNLSQLGAAGQNLYVPIPYQKSCKIVAEKNWGAYFQFVYQTFPKGTQLPTFSTSLVTEHAAALKRVDAFLKGQQGTDPAGSRAGEAVEKASIRAVAGQTVKVAALTGPRAITAIRARTAFKDRDDEMAGLRGLVLRITWDGETQPAVCCPLGDFFGTAPGVNLYKTLATGMTTDGFYAYWYMPFAKSATVELVNEDRAERQVQWEIVHAPLARPFAGLGHFHAQWHRDTAPLPPDRWPDWTMLQCEGRGRFCGVMLHVWNPRGGWWGEGDEKFFIDGEKFPSTIGTGSEDYFGYAWCHPGLFQRPYHAQSMTQGNRGHQSVLRWHITDNVPFQKSFEGAIEKYFTNQERGTLYACLPVWYLAPGGKDSYQPLPLSQRHGYYVKPPLEGEGFKVLGIPPGDVKIQGMRQYKNAKWKNGDQIWWTGAKPGNKLELAVNVKKAGRYRILAVLTKARDYAIVELSVDGKTAGNVDLYNPTVIPTDPPISLGVHELSEGEHKLVVQIVGANPQALKSYMFGIDEVRVEGEP